jgi:N-terminal region of Chorein or VPS13
VTVKKQALESLFMSMFGAPVTVVKGFIRKLRIDVPWNKLLSKPCEINIEDLHVVIKSSAHYDKEFAKRMLWKIKKGQFYELLQ